jgi:hypothetical protein
VVFCVVPPGSVTGGCKHFGGKCHHLHFHFADGSVTVAGWYRARRTKHCDHFRSTVRPRQVLIIPDSSTRELSGNNQHTSSSEAGETWTEVTVNFAYEYLFSCLLDSLTCRKILRHGTDGFTSPATEVVVRIVIAIKNPSPSDGFGPANLGSRGNHADYKTAEGDGHNKFLGNGNHNYKTTRHQTQKTRQKSSIRTLPLHVKLAAVNFI